MTEPRDLFVDCSLFLHALEMSMRPSTRHVHNTLVSVCGWRWQQYDALSVRERSTGEPADGGVEKIRGLIELHDVIAWGGVRDQSIPDPTKLTVHVIVSGMSGISQIPRINTSSSRNSKAAIENKKDLWGTERPYDGKRSLDASPTPRHGHHTLKLG